MANISLYVFILCFVLASSIDFELPHIHIKNCTDLAYVPMPTQISCQMGTYSAVKLNPCSILFNIYTSYNQNNQQLYHFRQLILEQQYRTFKCRHPNHINILKKEFFSKQKSSEENKGFGIQILVEKPELMYRDLQVSDEKYELNIDKMGASIKAQTYVGFVRGYETFLQSFNCSYHKNNYAVSRPKDYKCVIQYLPINISDQPQYPFRSILVDTSRHFLPIQILQQTIDALMYNKMNFLHWHITDDDSFPLCLSGEYRQLCEYGAFSMEQTYSIEQAKKLVRYAAVRGVIIIPQIDTPGHVGCWGLNPKTEGISYLNKNSQYQGVLDITLQKTYVVVQQIFKQILQIFPSKKIHLGGDQVKFNENYMQNLTNFLAQEKITNTLQSLHIKYREKQRSILEKMDSSRQMIYWGKEDEQFGPVRQKDIMQWWGKNNTYYPEYETHNRIIISHASDYYIDTGAGNSKGQKYSYGKYFTWFHLLKSVKGLKDYTKKLEGQKKEPSKYIMGVEATLWGEVTNQYTHHQKMWIRCTALAQQLWRDQELAPKPNFLRRMTKFEKLMNFRGIPTAPGTCQQCQTHAQFC